MIINVHRSLRKAPVILVRFQWYFNFLDILRKILKYKLHENPPRGSGVVPCGRTDGRTYRQTYRQTDMMKLTVDCRNFENAYKNVCKPH
jgi:inhibitor of KinA sporulation pathway (predicted exonuclease)